MKLRKIVSAVLALAMTVSLTACAGTAGTSQAGSTADSSAADSSADSSADGSSTASSEASESAYPGTSEPSAVTLNLAAEPPDMNTLTATYGIAFTVMRQLYDGLINLDANDNPIPGMAETWEISDDGLNYTFHLREGCTWTNGEPVTANDFVFGWSKLIDPAIASNYGYFGYQLFKNGLKYYNGECPIEDVGFKAVDDYTLEVTLENPTPYALFLFSFGSLLPVNEKFYNEIGGENYNIDAENFCTNGAYKMVSWTHDSNIVIEKNPDYWDADSILVNKQTFLMLTDTTTALASFKGGELDVVDLSGDQLTEMNNEGYPVTSYASGYTRYLTFNNADEFLSNENIRKALMLGFSRTDFIAAIIKNASKPAVSFTCDSVAGFDGSIFSDTVADEFGELWPSETSEEAKTYLETGLSELGKTAEELSAHLSINCNDQDVTRQAAEFLQEQYRVNLGLEMTINSMTTKAQKEEFNNMNYVINYGGWGPDYNDPMTFLELFETSDTNHSGFSDPEYDELVAKCRTEVDTEARQGYFLEIEKMLSDKAVICPIYWQYNDYIVSGKIQSGYWRTTFQGLNFGRAVLAE